MRSGNGTPLPFTIELTGTRPRVCTVVGEATVAVFDTPEHALAICTELNNVIANPHTYRALAAHFPTPHPKEHPDVA